jgi:hypothetical protein
MTPLVPIYTQASSKYFTPNIIPWTTKVNDVNVATAPLAFGVNIDILSISVNSELLEKHICDLTDFIDKTVYLKNIYIKLDNDVIVFDIEDRLFTRFDFKDGNLRHLKLHFSNKKLLIDSHVKQYNGQETSYIDFLTNPNNNFFIELSVTGSIDLETGLMTLFALPITNAMFNNKEITVIGYDLKAYRANSHRSNN